MLEVEGERAVRPPAQASGAVPDRVAVPAVGMQVALAVVHRQRPEGADRRQLTAIEADLVPPPAPQRPPLAVGERRGIHGLLRRVRAEGEPGHDGTAQVVAPEVADVGQRHEPSVVAPAAEGVGSLHRAVQYPPRGTGRPGERLPDPTPGLRGWRASGTDAGFGERAQGAAIGSGRRVRGEIAAQGVEVGQAARQLEGRLVGREGAQHQRRLALARRPARQGRGAVAAHEIGHGRQIGLAPDQGPAEQPHQRRRALDPPHTGRQVTAEAGRDERERARVRARGPPADVPEGVRVGVEQLEHVVAATRVRHVDDQRLGAQVELGDGVGGVDVRVPRPS